MPWKTLGAHDPHSRLTRYFPARLLVLFTRIIYSKYNLLWGECNYFILKSNLVTFLQIIPSFAKCWHSIYSPSHLVKCPHRQKKLMKTLDFCQICQFFGSEFGNFLSKFGHFKFNLAFILKFCLVFGPTWPFCSRLAIFGNFRLELINKMKDGERW